MSLKNSAIFYFLMVDLRPIEGKMGHAKAIESEEQYIWRTCHDKQKSKLLNL